MSAEVTSTLVTGSAATTIRCTGVGDCATASSTRSLEQLGIGEEQRRVPAEQHQAGDQPRLGIARDVVVALDAVDAAQHGGMRPPAVPQEFDDRDDDRQADAGNRAEHGDADEADDRQPELPALDAEDAARSSNSNRPMADAITTAASALMGRSCSRSGASDKQQGDGHGADHAGQLRSARPRLRRPACATSCC